MRQQMLLFQPQRHIISSMDLFFWGVKRWFDMEEEVDGGSFGAREGGWRTLILVSWKKQRTWGTRNFNEWWFLQPCASFFRTIRFRMKYIYFTIISNQFNSLVILVIAEMRRNVGGEKTNNKLVWIRYRGGYVSEEEDGGRRLLCFYICSYVRGGLVNGLVYSEFREMTWRIKDEEWCPVILDLCEIIQSNGGNMS